MIIVILVAYLTTVDGYVGFLMENLVECYRGDVEFVFKKKEVKLNLKDVVLISGLRVVTSTLSQTQSRRQLLGIDVSKRHASVLLGDKPNCL